jgi:hypothetical protein
MAGSRNHYETAFAGLLSRAGLRALAVDETRRPWLRGVQLKNFDFLVNGREHVWALDLKGRRDRPWITRADLFCMMGWQRLLAGTARPAFLFAFLREGMPGRLADLPCTELAAATGVYHFCLLELDDAQRLARPRSRRWGTFGFNWPSFARAARPLEAVFELDAVNAPRQFAETPAAS